jgi:N-acetylglucosamine kinase
MWYGLDIGGTKIELAVLNSEFELLHSWRVPTPQHQYDEFLQTVLAQIQQADALCQSQGTVGIALPGVIRSDGTVLSSNVPCLTNKTVALDLTRLLQRPVAIGNDCRCFALSEAVAGVGRFHQKVLGFILGTGAGGGFCLNGKLYQGASGLAGEYGHQGLSALVVQQFNLPLYPCGCGLTGCNEAYISGTGLARLYQHFSGRRTDTYQWLTDYRAGKDVALRTFEAYISALASVMANQILSLNPDLIVLGGGLSEIEEIRVALPQAITRHLFAGVSVPEIKQAQWGATSGVRGAALLGKALTEGQSYEF